MTVRRLFLHPIWLIVALPGYLGLRMLPALAWGSLGNALAVLLLLTSCLIVPMSVNKTALRNQRLADRLAWMGLLIMGFFASLFIAALLRDLTLVGIWLFSPTHDATSYATPTARWTLALTTASVVIGLIIARRPRLVVVDVPIAGLPAALQGFSIAQISDLHVGPTIKRGFVEQIVRRVNGLEADLIAVTGDLVDGSVENLSAHTAPLAGLSAPDGVYFVTGNHEYYSGARAWTAEIRRLGLTVLENQHVVIRRGAVSVILAGITDYTAHHFDPAQRSDPTRALLGAPADAAIKILLAHQPSSAPAAAQAGFDLQISGHTHGGQFWPWNLFVRYFQPFTSGLNRLQRLLVYVSRGTGYWGPPNRFVVPGEITKLRLIAA